MDFKSLLSLAKDNQSYNLKKYERDKLLKAKKSKDQVSDDAVKAFLAKKQLEAKTRKEAENKAKQERILARVEGKKADKKRGASSSATNGVKSHLQKQQRGPSMVKGGINERPSVAEVEQPKSGTKQGQMNRSAINTKSGTKSFAEQKTKVPQSNGAESRKQVEDPKRQKFPQVDPGKERKPVGKVASKPTEKKAGLSFSELMNMAKQQANKPVMLQKQPPAKANVKKKEEQGVNEAFDYERYEFEKSLARRKSKLKMSAAPKEDTDSAPPERAGSLARPTSADRSVSSSGKGQKPLTAKNVKEPLPPRRDKCVLVTKTLSRYSSDSSDSSFAKSGFKRPMPAGASQSKRPRVNSGQNRLRDIDIELERERRELEKKRKMFQNRYGGGGVPEDNYDYYDDYDDYDEEDDMDDFIDDSEAGPDVSSEIRKIFGYDRRKYCDDDDDDLDSMEASYSQIQQEEARSSRIGKLEDDIERLKELKELRKEKKRGR